MSALSVDAAQASFNGAPRLGLGEGCRHRWRRLRCRASMGLRDWVSEKAADWNDSAIRIAAGFNGAPRLGLGEGWFTVRSVGGAKCFNGAPRLGLGEGAERPGG